MGLDPAYQHIYQSARQLHDQFHDSLDNPNHPTAHVLRQEMRELYEDMEKKRPPRALEDRIKVIQGQLAQSHHQGQGLISPDHANHFHHHFEQLRRDVRSMPHY